MALRSITSSVLLLLKNQQDESACNGSFAEIEATRRFARGVSWNRHALTPNLHAGALGRLGVHCKSSASVLLVAGLVFGGADLRAFTEADDLKPVRIDSGSDQRFADRFRALQPQS